MNMEYIKSITVSYSCYFVFINTLTCAAYWQAHFDANYCDAHTTAIS